MPRNIGQDNSIVRSVFNDWMMDNSCTTFAAYNKDDAVRLASSSGGIFSALAEYVLDNNGVVYGVAMSIDCYSAEYIRVDDKREIKRLRGSKYIQAILGDTYHRVKLDLERGLLVLFSGTPCYVNGLRLFLQKEYYRLTCVDLICHGVPSSSLWKKYVCDLEERHRSKLQYVSFRCKRDGWKKYGFQYGIGVDSASAIEIYNHKLQNPYMRFFLKDYALRPSCYHCNAKKDKLSDITLADFWGIETILDGINDGKGISMVLARTSKGEQLLKALDNIEITEVPYEKSIVLNDADYLSAIKPKERDGFYKSLNRMSFRRLENKYLYNLKHRCKNVMDSIYVLINGGGRA